MERPLDALSKAKGKTITVALKNNSVVKGKLDAFDIHINLVLSDAEEINGEKLKHNQLFIRGDMVVHLSITN
jgi:small nuclear ribonucleoprotein